MLKHCPKIIHADNSVTLKDFLETVNIDDGSKLDMHQIVEVLLGSSFTNLDAINHDTLSVLTMNFCNGATLHLCVRLGSGKEQQAK